MNRNHKILETEDALDRLICRFKELIKDRNKDFFKFKGKSWNLSLNETDTHSELNLITPKTLEKIFENVENKNSSNSGTIFTPSWITDTMVDYTLDQWIFFDMNSYFSDKNMKTRSLSIEHYVGRMLENKEKEDYQSFTYILFNKSLRKVKILDPCVGGGAFITSLIQKIYKIFTQYYELNDCEDSKEIVTKICNFITENIFFADLNKYSIEITKIRIKCALITLFSRNYSHVIDTITFNSYLGNTLTKFGKDFPSKFHIIFGNPPYISSDNIKKSITQNTLNKLKENYSSVIKKGSKPDLYFYFMKRAVDHLEKNGCLSFIIPNRVLSNDYATKLRYFLLLQCHIQLIIDFNPKIQVFPGANVHPCIFIIKKREKMDIQEKKKNKHDHLYNSALIKDQSILGKFNLYNIEKQEISQNLSDMYNIFFTEISKEMQQFLISVNNFHRLKDIIKIHEGTRIARFKHKIPNSFPIRITVKQWKNLPKNKKSEYIGEIRGKDITQYHIGRSRHYITLPELLNQSKDLLKKSEIITDLSESTVYFRELGKKVYAGLKFKSSVPSIAYGGVYFFKENDINFKMLKKDPEIEILPAFLMYLSSDVVLSMYRTLFGASSWGSALKFRSNYFYKIPLIPFDIELFFFFGLLLTNLNSKGSSEIIQKQEYVIKWIENTASLCLAGSTIVNSEEYKLKEERNFTSSEFSEFIDDIKIIFRNYFEIPRLSHLSEKYELDFLLNTCQDIIQKVKKMDSYSQIYQKIKKNNLYKAISSI